MRALVVDDQESLRSLVRIAARQIGIDECFEAEDGQAALALLARGYFDLVISDLNMPRFDGLYLLRGMRKIDRHRATPFVFLTGSTNLEAISAARELGVAAIIAKPFSMTEFVKRLRPVMAARYPNLGAAGRA